jgi:hypothetical protein
MTDHNHPTNDRDADIDRRARAAGAEVRRPAPTGFTDGIRRARRRQQQVRAGLGGAVAVAVIALGAIALRPDDQQGVVPATDPSTTVPSTGTPTTVPGTSTPSTAPPDTTETTDTTDSGVTGPTIPPIATDADGVPDAIYAPTDETGATQDVFDPVTLTVRETVPSPTSPERIPNRLSASGAVEYTPIQDGTVDACGQNPIQSWVRGAEPTGLPAEVLSIALSADGKVGVVLTADCPTDVADASDGLPDGSYPITAVVFDPDRPDLAGADRFTIDGGTEALLQIELSDDGRYLLVSTAPRPLVEGNAATHRVIEVASGELIAEFGGDNNIGGLPHSDCGWGFLNVELVSSTSLAFTAICPDEGLAVVIHDFATGETFDEVNAEYVGRTYETMVSAGLQVDRTTYTSPNTAWFILCAERETAQPDGSIVTGADGSRGCWLGSGTTNEPMREIPTQLPYGAHF